MPALNDTKSQLKKYVKILQGKEYLQVSGRIWSAHNSRQLISIDTILTETEKYYQVKAVVTVWNNHVPDFETLPDSAKLGTYVGHAQSLKVGGQSAEKTNPLEVAETSAIGRALGFAGFGDLESIASFEEMEVAVSRKNSPLSSPGTPKDLMTILRVELGTLLKSRQGISNMAEADAESMRRYGVKSSKLTQEQLEEWIEDLKAPEPEVSSGVPF